MEKKPCLKCLLKEMDEAAYMEKLHRYIEMMDAKSRTAGDKYQERLNICKQCDYLEAGTCLACGCYVELRAATKVSDCPYKKW